MQALLNPNLTSDCLHLGCGLTAPNDWLNVDGSLQVVFARRPRLKRALVRLGVYPRSQAAIPWPTNVLRLNLQKQLPFPDASFVAVYSSHTFEHLFREEAVALARECYRVLSSKGVCRIVVPDLAAAVQKYLKQSSQGIEADSAADQFMDELLVHPRAPKSGLLGLYHRTLGYHQHKWMYDANSLNKLLIDAGFSDVTNPPCQQGRLPRLLQIEAPIRVEAGLGVIAEGIKP